MPNLQPFHTFHIAAQARKIIQVQTLEQLQQAWQAAQAENLPTLILGQGSNVLFLEDFNGVVIVVEVKAEYIHIRIARIAVEIVLRR